MDNINVVDAIVLSEIKDGYRLKVSVADLGMYIFGFRAIKSSKFSSGFWVQPPSTKIGAVWKANPEFDKSKEFWSEITGACVMAIKDYESGSSQTFSPSNEELSESSFDEAYGLTGTPNKNPTLKEGSSHDK